MNPLYARIRHRLLRPLRVTTFQGDDLCFQDWSVLKVKRRGLGVSIWTYDADEREVTEWWYPQVDEVRITR